jgi:U3 small nucleolar RNA-associated protein 14
MRNLLFKHEMKAKRVKAIKSKTFHRHNRKTGAMKVIDGETGEEIGDDDAALEGLDPDNSAEAKREYLRAQERMLLKHKNTSRWAKRAIKKGLAHLPGTKEAIAEQLRIGQELKRKIGIGGERGASRDSDDEEYSTDAESDSDGDVPGGGGGAGDAADRRRALAKAKLRTMQAIEEGQAGAEEEGGLFALPFMARHMKKKREEAETEAKQLLEEIEKAEREAATQRDSDDEGLDGQPGDGDWGKGAEKFDEPEPAQRTSRIMSFGGGGGGGRFVSAKGAGQPAKNDVDSDDDELTVKPVDPPGDDSDDDTKTAGPNGNDGVRKARGANRAARRAAAAGEGGDPKGASQVPELVPKAVSTSEVKEITAVAKKSGSALKARMAARASGRGAVVVTAVAATDRKIDMAMDRGGDDMDDEAGGAANLPVSNGEELSQRDLLSRAFAGDDVVGEFETDKNAEVTGELPKIDVPKQMPGWGGWAEDQAKRGPPKWQLEAERKAKREQQKALKARRDADLKHVVISERYDKKVAGFNVEHLPHGFDSKAVYEGSMRMPLGPDANTDKSFRDMTRPAVLKAAGTVIRPMTFPKGRQAKKKA